MQEGVEVHRCHMTSGVELQATDDISCLEFDACSHMTLSQPPHRRYLCPETAQSHFLNFSHLLEFNNSRIPFASTQIGRAFRNEISPRAGLPRVREFTMAEIEHYVDPADKSHARFGEVAHVVLALLDRDVQLAGAAATRAMSVGEAVARGVVANETLGYFLAWIHLSGQDWDRRAAVEV